MVVAEIAGLFQQRVGAVKVMGQEFPEFGVWTRHAEGRNWHGDALLFGEGLDRNESYCSGVSRSTFYRVEAAGDRRDSPVVPGFREIGVGFQAVRQGVP